MSEGHLDAEGVSEPGGAVAEVSQLGLITYIHIHTYTYTYTCAYHSPHLSSHISYISLPHTYIYVYVYTPDRVGASSSPPVVR